MNRRSRISIAVLAVVALAAVAIVGTSASSAAKKKPSLAVAKTSLGKVLVDAKGRTLYRLSSDGKNKSTCADACAANWPPAIAPKKPTVGTGVSKSRLKVIKRADGKKQLSYNGHPLYEFIGDSKKGDVNGQGINAFGGIWNVLTGKGKPVTSSSSTSTGTSTGSTDPNPYPGYSSASGSAW